ncbi:nucleotidyltransferase domain-containing protein [Capnocytophaga cynodegmi]|uniref:Putative nucleotidyltransferase n=1 Tax=Capnocytophaga cynodegmi TaxID=28189 RepID=A0A0B7HK22_9FLAO|nr:nucleotidyltransferase domain-containing protein [Capnocytophaga cynodegmi]CEN34172.1 putative nucleotidyltransferase [Capnocytophaga cynodegmi]CEN37888.1 putative nucleotidyltransferase [Capnocytophaga cynodegmi]
MTVKNRILEKIKEVEHQYSVEVLYVVESGSRAWGFASPDSDFDIRFIYKSKVEHYLSLWEQPDTIEFMTDENLDGSGWDLKKTLLLLAKSNTPLLEWLYSPVIYFEKPQLIKSLRSLAQKCFSPIACMYHYLGMSKNFSQVCQQDNVKLKSYLYALRTALAGKWIAEKNSFPPVAFSQLLTIAPANIQTKIQEIMNIKASQNESYLHPKEELITNFLIQTLTENSQKANNLSAGEKIHHELNTFFLETLKQ